MKKIIEKILSVLKTKKRKEKVSLYRKKNILEINMIGGKYIRSLSFSRGGKREETTQRLYEFLFQNEEIINDYTFTRIMESLLSRKGKHFDLIFRTPRSIVSYEEIPKSFLYPSKTIYRKQILSEIDRKEYRTYSRVYPKRKTDLYRTYLLPLSSISFIEHLETKFHIHFDTLILTGDMLYDCYKNKKENLLFLFRTYTLVTLVILKKGYPVLEKSFTVNQYMDFVRPFSLALSRYEKENPKEPIDRYFLKEKEPRIREYLLKIGIHPEEGELPW